MISNDQSQHCRLTVLFICRQVVGVLSSIASTNQPRLFTLFIYYFFIISSINILSSIASNNQHHFFRLCIHSHSSIHILSSIASNDRPHFVLPFYFFIFERGTDGELTRRITLIIRVTEQILTSSLFCIVARRGIITSW